MTHLTPKHQQELLQLIDKYADRFSEIPGLTTRAEHCVELMPGFKPKRMRAYNVPEKLQPEVERQLLIFFICIIYAVLVAVRKFKHCFFWIKANRSQ